MRLNIQYLALSRANDFSHFLSKFHQTGTFRYIISTNSIFGNIVQFALWGDGTNSFPVDLNTNILENTTPFLCSAATLDYRSFELVNS